MIGERETGTPSVRPPPGPPWRLEIGKRQLNDDEAGYLRIALASKLLELTAYRPYELEFSDCHFVVSGPLATRL